MKGAWGEKAARLYLEKRGWHTAATNFRTRFGEIDIIAENAPVSYTHLDVYKRQVIHLQKENPNHLLDTLGIAVDACVIAHDVLQSFYQVI